MILYIAKERGFNMRISEYLDETLEIKPHTIFHKQITNYLDTNYYQIDLKKISNNSHIARFFNGESICLFYWQGTELVMYEKGLCSDKTSPFYGYEYTRYAEKGATYSKYTLELYINNEKIKSSFILKNNKMLGKIYNPKYLKNFNCSLSDKFYFEPEFFSELSEFVNTETISLMNYNKENTIKLTA